jgi:hypothetical protein
VVRGSWFVVRGSWFVVRGREDPSPFRFSYLKNQGYKLTKYHLRYELYNNYPILYYALRG